MALNATIPGLAIAGCVLCGILAALHIYIFVLEAILWRKRAAKAFRLPQSTVEISVSLAANQGFYNLLLAVGLIWGLAELNPSIMLYFSAAIFTAGIFGAITASPRIVFVQVIPGLLAFVFVDFGFLSTKFWSYWKHPLYLFLLLIGAGLMVAILSFIIKSFFIENQKKISSKPDSSNDNL